MSTGPNDPTPPYRVTTLDEYVLWIEEVLGSSGGYLDGDGYLEWQLVPDPLDGTPVTLLVADQRVHFHNGTFLDFGFVVDVDLNLLEYGYHLQTEDGFFVCRLDKHEGHEDVAVGENHVHTGREGKRVNWADEYNLEQAIEYLLNYYEEEWRRPG